MCIAVSVSGVHVTHTLLAFEKRNGGLHVKHVKMLALACDCQTDSLGWLVALFSKSSMAAIASRLSICACVSDS